MGYPSGTERPFGGPCRRCRRVAKQPRLHLRHVV